MNFKHFQDMLLFELRERIRSGVLTERRLAKVAGISQPHVHNVLKGKRSFSLEMADRVLYALGMDLLDLVDPDEWAQRRPNR